MKTNLNKSTVFLCVLMLALTLFFGCNNKKEKPVVEENFTVTFMVEQSIYKEYKVKKNTRIKAPEEPNFLDENKKFSCWKKEDGTIWNFQIGIVTSDLKLVAAYVEVLSTPTDLNKAFEPVSSKLTWKQKSLSDNKDYEIKIVNTLTNETIFLDGTFSFDSINSIVTFTPNTIPQGGVYNVFLKDKSKNTNNTISLDEVIFSGEGTLNNPYLIATAKDFEAVSLKNVNKNTYFSLLNNIEISPFRNYQKDFVFNGTLLGNGKTITLYEANCGAINKIGSDGVVSNLILAGKLTTTLDSVGILADYNEGKIEKVTTTAYLESTAGSVGKININNTLNPSLTTKRGIAGLIVGTNEENGVIEDCIIASQSTTTGRLIANICGGGIAGFNYGSILNCHGEVIIGGANAYLAKKSTSKYSYCGGIVGINAGIIEKCFLNANSKILAQRYIDMSTFVEGTNNISLGGIAGYNLKNATIKESSFTGIRVHGDENVGGICGDNEGTISDCSVLGTLNTINDKFMRLTYIAGRINVGGIAGKDNGIVTRCLVTANVFGFTKDEPSYSISKNATNSVYFLNNPNSEVKNAFTGAISDDYALTYDEKANISKLIAPKDTNSISIKENFDGKTDVILPNNTIYLNLLGDKFKYLETVGISLKFIEQSLIEETIEIYLYDNASTFVKTFTLGNTPKSIGSIYKIGYIFKGWATSINDDVKYESDTNVTINDFKYLINGNEKIKLYAVQEKRENKTNVKVAIWARYFSLEQIEELKNKLNDLAGASFNIEYVIFDDENYHAVASLGQAINEAGNFDIIIGNGANISTTGTVKGVIAKALMDENINTLEKNRQAALLCDNTNALTVYAYLINSENKNVEVNFLNVKIVVLNSVILNSEAVPKLPDKPNYSFIGWSSVKDSLKVDLTSEAINYLDIESFEVESKITFYPVYMLTSAESKALLTIKGDTDVLSTLGSVSLNKATIPNITVPNGKKFIGFSTIKDATTAEINEDEITYNTIKDLLVDGKLTLYPVFKEEAIKSNTLKIAIWTKSGSWVSNEEIENIKISFENKLTLLGYDLNTITLTYKNIETETNKVQDLGKLTNEENPKFDIVIGCGKNITTSGNVETLEKTEINTNFVKENRLVARLTDNSLAILLYEMLI